MAVSVWPSTLPAFLRVDYGVDLPELNSATDFALGRRTRPLYADGPDTVSASVLLSSTQLAILLAWYRYDLHNGTDWFAVPILAAGGLATREVRITEAPRTKLVGVHHYRVSLPLETRTGTTMSRAEWDALNP